MRRFALRSYTRSAIPIAAALASLTLSAGAQAQVVIGQVAPPSFQRDCAFELQVDLVPKTIASGNGYAVPSAGVITSWSTNAGVGTGTKLAFKVFRPLGPTSWRVVGHSDLQRLTPSSLNTFKVAIPVQAGDVIGLNDPGPPAAAACVFETNDLADSVSSTASNGADNSMITQEVLSPAFRLNVSATFLPPPTIGTVSPAAGSIAGGAGVTIAGANFAEVKSVSFGGVPATSFKLDSESKITAVAPPSATLSKADIAVATLAGSATASQAFSYEGCLVPKLRGKKLRAAKALLRKANCKLGMVKKIRGATPRRGRVVKQNPKPGALRAPGAAIGVTLKG